MNNNFLFYLGKISLQVLLDVIYFPLWWYSIGLFRLAKRLGIFLKERWIFIGAGVWLKNLFVPMYGQTDIGSRIISFFMRFVQIIFRFATFLVFVIVSVVSLVLWVGLPILLLVLIFQKEF